MLTTNNKFNTLLSSLNEKLNFTINNLEKHNVKFQRNLNFYE